MKRIIASPRLCTLRDISVHRPPDSDILMPKGSATGPGYVYTVGTAGDICTCTRVYIPAAFEHRIPRVRGQSLGASPHYRRRASLRLAHMSAKLDRAIQVTSRGVTRSPGDVTASLIGAGQSNAKMRVLDYPARDECENDPRNCKVL